MHNIRPSMLWLIGFALIAIQLIAVSAAHAAPVPFALSLPTKNTDGTAIPTSGAGAITKWRVEYGTCTGTAFGTKQGEVLGVPATLTGITPDLAPGIYCLQARATNSFNSESDPNNALVVTVPPPKPMPPGLTVTAPTAFEFKPSTNTMARVGLVPIGTACGPETKVISGVTYCKLPTIQADFVNWPTNLKIAEVWAVGG